ncbi:MAG TPA: glycosyltransferase family 4 protein [Xanthobacteraceae bacterium]|jgi:glycosyltransferase involved in cell wall biosynthesis|nr:glycosyltransferase family 4 protein [Xanthobacteraceae bacterium]
MRILQILHDNERGGVQTLAGMIETALGAHRIAVETDYLYPRPGLPPYTKLVYVLRMMRRIWNADADALIAYQSSASILTGVVGWLRGCKLRVVHQTCIPSELPRPLRVLDKLSGALGLYTANIINSAATWAEFAAYPTRYRRAMILIEHGIEVPVPAADRDATRRRFGLPQTQPVLLNVGRLATQKNQDVLVRALACLPQAHLVLAGAGQSAESFHALAATLGVDDRLHMLGALPAEDIADLYAASDVFVFPSIWETFGLAAVEAGMAGMPMVVADLPVLHEVLRAGGERVAFVGPYDVEGWIAAIARALKAVPAERAADAFARALCAKYSSRRMIDSYLSLFEAHRRHQREKRQDLAPMAEKVRS